VLWQAGLSLSTAISACKHFWKPGNVGGFEYDLVLSRYSGAIGNALIKGCVAVPVVQIVVAVGSTRGVVALELTELGRTVQLQLPVAIQLARYEAVGTLGRGSFHLHLSRISLPRWLTT